MKHIAVISTREDELLETKSFRSRVEVERYIASKYHNEIFDWMIESDYEWVKETFREVKKHSIKVYLH